MHVKHNEANTKSTWFLWESVGRGHSQDEFWNPCRERERDCSNRGRFQRASKGHNPKHRSLHQERRKQRENEPSE